MGTASCKNGVRTKVAWATTTHVSGLPQSNLRPILAWWSPQNKRKSQPLLAGKSDKTSTGGKVTKEGAVLMVELLLEKDLYRVPAGRAYLWGGGPPQLFPNSPWCWPWHFSLHWSLAGGTLPLGTWGRRHSAKRLKYDQHVPAALEVTKNWWTFAASLENKLM